LIGLGSSAFKYSSQSSIGSHSSVRQSNPICDSPLRFENQFAGNPTVRYGISCFFVGVDVMKLGAASPFLAASAPFPRLLSALYHTDPKPRLRIASLSSANHHIARMPIRHNHPSMLVEVAGVREVLCKTDLNLELTLAAETADERQGFAMHAHRHSGEPPFHRVILSYGWPVIHCSIP
jgi:hypothetical protein